MFWRARKNARARFIAKHKQINGVTRCGFFRFFCHSDDQILREINFGDSRSSRFNVFAILGVRNLVNLVNFSLQKVQKFIKNQLSQPLIVLKMLILHFWNGQN